MASISTEAASRPLTIGEAVEELRNEFDDISISKVRYLEDQGLISPKRTPGGYRLYHPQEMERLRTILHLQRDRFMPLAVIKGHLDTHSEPYHTTQELPALRHFKMRNETLFEAEEVQQKTGVSAGFLKELEEYGLVRSHFKKGGRYFEELDARIIASAAALANFGVGGRNLRLLKTSSEREASLIAQIFTPSLRAPLPDRREAALKDLEEMAKTIDRLGQLLLLRELRDFLHNS